MQRRKPFEAQINQKENSIEKKVITKKIQHLLIIVIYQGIFPIIII